MASAFSHAIVALAMGKAFQNKELSWRELFLGALCSVVPDLDAQCLSLADVQGFDDLVRDRPELLSGHGVGANFDLN